MATLQFYRNKYYYPHYSHSISTYGAPMECTPVGMNFKSGALRVKGDMTDFMECNYLAFTRDGVTLYAWIDDVQYLTQDSFQVTYSVDAWRTYKNKINLGKQFIARRPQESILYDKLLGGSTDYPEIDSLRYPIGDPGKRVFVVQVRAGEDETFSNSPVNPTPYQFYMKEFDFNNWTSDPAIEQLMSTLSGGAETQNIVTMYSIPYMDLSSLTGAPLNVVTASGTTTVNGFKGLTDEDPKTLLHNVTPIQFTDDDIKYLLRTDHSVQLVVPEAGVIDIPDELLTRPDLGLRQDIDLFSGASNYMLVTGDGGYTGEVFTQSVRGSSISSIPIVSDPYDTYMSQNQNALATSLIGDVASIAGGVAIAAGAPGIGTAIGGGSVLSGINGIINRSAGIKDSTSQYSNPPAFLGTALVSNYNQSFWIVTRKTGVENATEVHSNFGYPWNLVGALSFPSSGYIQTQGCAVMSTDGSVPRWAMTEINGMFNNGVLVHA